MASKYPKRTLDSIYSLFILLSLNLLYFLLKLISPENHQTKTLALLYPQISLLEWEDQKFTLINGWESESRHLSQVWPQVFEYDSGGVSVQFSSVAQSCSTLCDPMNRSTPGLPVQHQRLEFTQTRVHRVSDVIQPSHPLLSPFPPTPNPSQHQSLFQWVNSSHEVVKVLEFQL